MSKLKVIISDEAANDLEKIWVYTFQNWSKDQADRYYNLIWKEVQHLSVNPRYGKNQGHLRNGYRSAKVKSHVIFYRVAEDEIEIIRILHENMDIPNRLED